MSDFPIPDSVKGLIALCDQQLEMLGCPPPRIERSTWEEMWDREDIRSGPRVELIYGDTFNDCLLLRFEWGHDPWTWTAWDGTEVTREPRQAPQSFSCSMPIPNEVIDGHISSSAGRYRRCGAKFTSKNMFKFIQYGRRWLEARHFAAIHQTAQTTSRLRGLK